MKVRIKKMFDNAILPSYGSMAAAGADLYAYLDNAVEIKPGETVILHTGIIMEIPDGYVGLVYARSGMATRRGLAPANKVGVIDSDYRGEIMIPMHNHSSTAVRVENGERVAQIILTPYLKAEFEITDRLDETERGTSGFGSTGIK